MLFKKYCCHSLNVLLVQTILPLRYDIFLFIDETHALRPLHMPNIDDKDFPETFPSGV